MDNSQRIQILISYNHSAEILNIHESYHLGDFPLLNVYHYNLIAYPDHMLYDIVLVSAAAGNKSVTWQPLPPPAYRGE